MGDNIISDFLFVLLFVFLIKTMHDNESTTNNNIQYPDTTITAPVELNSNNIAEVKLLESEIWVNNNKTSIDSIAFFLKEEQNIKLILTDEQNLYLSIIKKLKDLGINILIPVGKEG